MKRLLLIFTLLVCCFISRHAETVSAAPRIAGKPDRFEKMTHAELFDWAMNTPIENKPWRVVAKIEMAQKDPVEWGWNVNSELETAIAKKYPKCQGITVWQAWIACGGSEKPINPGHVSITIWHLRITDGELGELSTNKW